MDALAIRPLPLAEWLSVVDREYLSEFVPAGGAAVKLVVLDHGTDGGALRDRLLALGRGQGMQAVAVDAAHCRVHLAQELFFAVARALPWDSLVQRYVEAVFAANGYAWPRPGEAMTMADLAVGFGVAPTLLSRQRDQWLTAAVWHDRRLAQDFRAAMLLLCLSRLEADGADTAPVRQWLTGEKVPAAQLGKLGISSRIARTNARAMLVSLCHFLREVGVAGLLLVLDVRGLAGGTAEPGAVRYSPATVMDAYEVLRELIDDVEHLPGLFVAVPVNVELATGDPRRALSQYTALQMRVWPDVRPGDRQNPVAPMVWLAP